MTYPRIALLLAALALSAGPGAPPAAAETSAAALPSLAPMLKQVTPAVVNVAVKADAQAQDDGLFDNPLFRDPFFRRFFDLPEEGGKRSALSAGSGVIIDAEQGYVVTNHHVVANAETVEITTRDRRTYKAELVGADPQTDLALLRIDAPGLTALPLGDSDALQVGDFVVAIGNPFGLGQTVTLGIVSALGRGGLGLEDYEDFIQTDASINPGNSGGALVDLEGRLVGINTAILGGRGGSIGIGFAIPVNMMRVIAGRIAESGTVERGQLGVRTQDLTPELAEGMGMDAVQGVVVVAVREGSAAAQAGLAEGDVVLTANGRAVRDSVDLRNQVGLARVGDPIELGILRDGTVQTVRAVIGEAVDEQAVAAGDVPYLAGATLAPTSEDAGEPAGVRVVAVEPGSPAEAAGLQAGDIVTAVNRRPVDTPDGLVEAARAGGGRISLQILRGDSRLFILIG